MAPERDTTEAPGPGRTRVRWKRSVEPWVCAPHYRCAPGDIPVTLSYSSWRIRF